LQPVVPLADSSSWKTIVGAGAKIGTLAPVASKISVATQSPRNASGSSRCRIMTTEPLAL
jgi:hypothetical protein